MKDISQELLESSHPNIEPLYGIEFCLSQLYADKTHTIHDEIVKSLTFEELLGVLLIAKNTIQDYEKIIREYEEDMNNI